MRFDVYTPLLVSLLLAAIIPVVTRQAAPAVAARILTATGLATAASFLWALVLLSASLYDDVPPIAALARHDGVRIPEPVPDVIGLGALALATWCGVRVWRVVARHRASRRMLRHVAAAHDPDTEIIVADSPVPRAFAVPHGNGHIFITSAMLRGLSAADRKVLLAHERSHLANRHHRLRLAADLLAAANPLLIPVREGIVYLMERWADEDAVGSTGNRGRVAEALARAALLSRPEPAAAPLLGFTQSSVSRRITALSAPRTPLRTLAAGPAVAGLFALIAIADATKDFLLLIPHQLL